MTCVLPATSRKLLETTHATASCWNCFPRHELPNIRAPLVRHRQAGPPSAVEMIAKHCAVS